MPSSLYNVLAQTATAHVDAYSDPDCWDGQAIWKIRTPDCVHHLYPKESLTPPYNEAITKDTHLVFLESFRPLFDSTTFVIKDMVIDAEKRSVVTRLEATSDFKAIGDVEAAEQGWKWECMWMTHMDATGTKIIRVDDFLDVERLIHKCAAKLGKTQDLEQASRAI